MRTLVVAPSWVGDMVMAQVLFKVLKQASPETPIDIFAPKWCLALGRAMPEVADCIENPFAHGALQIKKRWLIAKMLENKGYTQAFVLPNSLKSSLIPFWAKIPRRIGWRGEWRYGLINQLKVLDKAALPLMIQRFAALADFDGEAIPHPRLQIPNAWQQTTLVEKHAKEKPIVFCPGAEFGPSKQWPMEKWRTLLALVEKDYPVIVLGSPKDKSFADQFVDEARNLCGRTSLEDAMALIDSARAVVTHDSGLMHIASALERPIVAIYGSSTPAFTPPLSKNAQIIRTGIGCSPCFKRTCPLGHHQCMQDISPEMVYESLRAAL